MKTKTTALRYEGLPATIYLPSGRVMDLEPGEVYQFPPSEAEALEGRPDFTVPEEEK